MSQLNLIQKLTMKLFVLLVVTAALYLAILGEQASALPAIGKNDLSEWESFKLRHNKVYESQGEEVIRRSIFAKNKKYVEEFNARNETYRLAINRFSDLSESEREAQLGGFKLPEGMLLKNSKQAEEFLQSILNDNSTDVPEHVDWRLHPGRVTPVKAQLKCAAAWAFAAAGALEGQVKAKSIRDNSTTGDAIELSEQNLIDCATENKGCDGGSMLNAFELVHQEGGINDEESYPYEGRNGDCRFNKDKAAFSDKGGALLPFGDEDKLKEVVAKFGPVAVAYEAHLDFELLGGGVYFYRGCRNKPENLNHAMLVIGYGSIEGLGDYWIIKNSWGSDWAEGGYALVCRGCGNNCGIASAATIPTF